MRIRSSRQINENNNCHVLYTAVAIHTDSLLQTAEHLVRTPYAYERKFSFHTRLKTKFFAVFVCVRDWRWIRIWETKSNCYTFQHSRGVCIATRTRGASAPLSYVYVNARLFFCVATRTRGASAPLLRTLTQRYHMKPLRATLLHFYVGNVWNKQSYLRVPFFKNRGFSRTAVFTPKLPDLLLLIKKNSHTASKTRGKKVLVKFFFYGSESGVEFWAFKVSCIIRLGKLLGTYGSLFAL